MSDTPNPRSFPSRPIVGTGAAVIRDKEILLVRRAKEPKKDEWSLPGGAVKLGETVKDALVRECYEETGLKIKPQKLLDIVEFIENKDDRVAYHYILHDWLAVLLTDIEPVANDDVTDARFFPFEEAIKLVTWSETQRIIKLAFEQWQDIRNNNE